MDDELHTLVRRNLEIAKENNRLLRRMSRAAAIGAFFRFVWLALLIGAPVFVYYYYLVPYYEGLSQSYQQFEEEVIQIPFVGPLLDSWLGKKTGNTQP